MFGDEVSWTCPDLLWFFCKQVRTQQIHEMKKKEKEYIKLQASIYTFIGRLCSRNSIAMALKVPMPNLQEKLNQVLMEKKKESSRSGMEIMNLLQVICLWIFLNVNS